jgi:hypothetical protein
MRHYLGSDYGCGSCALQVQAQTADVDESFDVDLSKLVGGRSVGAYRLVDDSTALLDVWHDDEVTALNDDKCTPRAKQRLRPSPHRVCRSRRVAKSHTSPRLPRHLRHITIITRSRTDVAIACLGRAVTSCRPSLRAPVCSSMPD